MVNSSDSNIELSISIVNYNTTDKVLDLIQSIKSNLINVVYEILVVDNNSADDPSRILLRFEEVKLILNSANVYFTKADNQNLARAMGMYIVSLNPDTLVNPSALENMIAFLRNNERVGAVTPKFIFPDNTLQSSITPFLTFRSSLRGSLSRLFYISKTENKDELGLIYYNPDITQEAEVLYGACIMIRREVLLTVGLKDEKFVHGWDEYDWCMRIKKAGWKLYYVHNSVILHYRSESLNKIRDDSRKIKAIDKYGSEGYYYLHKKHFGYLAYLFLRMIWILIGLLSRIHTIFTS